MNTENETDHDREHTTGPVGVPLDVQVAIHTVQLAAGAKSFAELRGDIVRTQTGLSADLAQLKERIMPKPINWLSVVFGCIAVLTTILGAWWGLSQQFSDRPTRTEIKASAGEQQKSLDQQAAELRTVRDQQTEQRILLNTVRDEVKDTGRKIDQLLQKDSAPAPGRSR
jgi:hypothetical protein